MPQKTTKKGKQCQKGTGKKGEKTPEKSLDSIGVRECMVWGRGGGGGGAPSQNAPKNDEPERETKFLMRKGELGKPADRGYVYPEGTPRPVEDEGTVLEALRGWPGQRREAEEYENEDQDACAQDAYISGGMQSTGKKTGSGKKSGKKGTDNGKGDPPMVYLVAHKYLSDFERKKMEEDEEERQKELEKKRSVDYAAMSELQGNKTSKLRAIRLANQTQTDAKDLWKMKKFTRAKSHLDTFRKNEKNKKGKAGEGAGAGDDSGCTCGLNLNDTYQQQPTYQQPGDTYRYYDNGPLVSDREPLDQQIDYYNFN